MIYSSAVNPRTMYVNMANSALPIPRMSIPIDSPMVLRTSRHPITEAGFDTIFKTWTAQGNAAGTSTGTAGSCTRGSSGPKGRICPATSSSGPRRKGRPGRSTSTPRPDARGGGGIPAGGGADRAIHLPDLKAESRRTGLGAAFDPDKRWGESKGCSRAWLVRRQPGRRQEARPRLADCQTDGQRASRAVPVTTEALLFVVK